MTGTPIYDKLFRESILRQAGIHIHKSLYGDFGYTWCFWCGGSWDGLEDPTKVPCSFPPIELVSRHALMSEARKNGRASEEMFKVWASMISKEYPGFIDRDGNLLF